VPDDGILSALKVAALSGIDVRLIFPGRPDHPFVYWASLSYVSELLQAGVKCYRYEKGFIHSKMMAADGVLSSVGTANMDIRSFDQNFEVNALIYDHRITIAMRNIFMNDIKDLKHININDWNERPRWVVFRESVARLFSPLL
jgi:cardiolipin synthase